MTKYYFLTGIHRDLDKAERNEDNRETIYGSFNRADVVYEKEAETNSYMKMKIESRDETPELDISIKDAMENTHNENNEENDDQIVFTSNELFLNQAPSFNFELDEPQLLAKALEIGFVTKTGDDQYLVNQDY